MHENLRHHWLMLVSVLGFSISALAGLAEHVSWLQSFCTGFSNGCRETAEITLLRVPIWVWGMGYYGLLALSVYRFRSWLVWLVPVAVGTEATLIWVMFSMNAVCVFCLANVMIVLLLIGLSIRRNPVWQTLAVSLLAFLFSVVLIAHENEIHASSGAKQDQSRVVARIGDEAVTEGELEGSLSSQIFDLQMEIYRLKRERLDEILAEILLRRESKQRGITVDQLVSEVMAAAQVRVEESEIDSYLQDNADRLRAWSGSAEELRQRIRSHLEQQKQVQEVLRYAKSLEPKYAVAIELQEPQPPPAVVNTEGSPSLGPANASVTVVEFSDYQCPACRGSHEVVRKVREKYAGQVRWVFKDYPLKRHKDAQRAAEAARCAVEQNRFWEYQDVLYATRDELTAERLEQLGKGLGMDTERFRECLASGRNRPAVEKDVEDAKRNGIDRTPTFIVNGRRMNGGASLEAFQQMIDEELKKSKGILPQAPPQQ